MNARALHSFGDELEKIANGDMVASQRDNKITKKRFKKFLRTAAVGAAGTGIGYGVGQLAGRPLERWLLRRKLVTRSPAKALKVGLGVAAAAGTVAGLGRVAMGQKLVDEVGKA